MDRQSLMPGDVVIGDEDGCIAFAFEDAKKVLQLCEKGKEVDAKRMAALQAGRGVTETFAEYKV